MHTWPSTSRPKGPACTVRPQRPKRTRAHHREGDLRPAVDRRSRCENPSRVNQGRERVGAKVKAAALWVLPSVESVGRKAQLQRARGAGRIHRQVSARTRVQRCVREHPAALPPAVSRRDGDRGRKSRNSRRPRCAPSGRCSSRHCS